MEANFRGRLKATWLDSREEWDREKLLLILDKLADGTRKSYSLGWRWWLLFCMTRRIEPLRRKKCV